MVPPDKLITQVVDWLVILMQVSVLVPMAVVWVRRRRFSPTVKLLSWYVYLSAAMVAGSQLLYPAYFATNYYFIIGFNLGKIALLGAVYAQVFTSGMLRRVAVAVAVVAVVGGLGVVGYDANLAVAVSRVSQCAVLAGFALFYLEQTLNRPVGTPLTHDPLWLLSVGQLIYSAGTVTSFSLNYLSVTVEDQNYKFLVIPFAGLAFNWFLTLAFLRARPVNTSPPGSLLAHAPQFASL